MKIPSLKKILKSSEVPTPTVPLKKAPVKKAAVKKVAVKKAAVKVEKKASVKAVPKKADAKRLVVASDSESFWATNGHVLNSLVALEMALKIMSKADYSYHISESGSDFADWVESVLMASKCADELRKAKTAKAAQLVVANYLKEHKL